MPLAGQLPQLERFTYLKFKNEILIINPMSRQVADIFPESQADHDQAEPRESACLLPACGAHSWPPNSS
jgi:hypothetical protein